MKFLRFCSLAALLVAMAMVGWSREAKADTFSRTFLYGDGGIFFYGMDDARHVVLAYYGGAFPCPDICYMEFTNGMRTPGVTATPPALSYDNGTPCTPAIPAGGALLHGVCNGGLDAFTGYIPGQHFPGVYFGSPSNLSTVSVTGEGLLYMNSLGDIVYDDHFTENWYLAVRTADPVPEPASFVLLGTGVLACVGAVRRRLFSRA